MDKALALAKEMLEDYGYDSYDDELWQLSIKDGTVDTKILIAHALIAAEKQKARYEKVVVKISELWFNAKAKENEGIACWGCDTGQSGRIIDSYGHDIGCEIAAARAALKEKELPIEQFLEDGLIRRGDRLWFIPGLHAFNKVMYPVKMDTIKYEDDGYCSVFVSGWGAADT